MKLTLLLDPITNAKHNAMHDQYIVREVFKFL